MQYAVEHIGLASLNPTALKDWYVSVLGATVALKTGEPPAYFIDLAGGYQLEIYQADSQVAQTAVNRVAGWRHLALRVASLESARDQLSARGVQFNEPVKPAGGGGQILFFQDPDGNLLHLVERPTSS